MAFAFPDTNTERFDLSKILVDSTTFPLEYVKAANTARQRMCDTLVVQPATQAALDSIEEYLPYLQYIIDKEEKLDYSDKKMKFSWRSVLSKGIRMSLRESIIEKPIVRFSTIWFEAMYVLLAYGFTLANMANKRLGSSPSSATESAYTEAADLFSRASGVFRIAGLSWGARWTDKKDAPPECSAEMVSLLSQLMIAEANRAALSKAERRGMSPATLIKVGSAVISSFDECISLVRLANKRDSSELADTFKSYIEDGSRLAEAAVLKRFGSVKHEEGENGVAVAAMTLAHNQLLKCASSDWAPYKKMAKDQLPEVEELRSTFVRLNNNITYQRVPELGEVKGLLPPGFAIVEQKGFILPPIVEPERSEKLKPLEPPEPSEDPK
ncbi:hypothetical protein PSACC_03594 [Paramicrosporidium saccamoebae]|uniref:pH-response regulator protein palC n=1 Tax=Paramicrosporidium saccamoebae TaxID=1246581 RepID=A0A2H9TFN4_9FUNG|nr:hypothetical protein PSACC_03594 [Paramicrosporidium saccamoebae]